MRLADRRPALVLVGALALLAVAIALPFVAARQITGPGAARLVPASALAYVRLGTDRGSDADRRLAAVALRVPTVVRLRDRLVAALAPSGGLDLRRDVRPWLGDEVAVALVDLGGGRFASAVLAAVASRPKAEALLQRVGAARAGVRYRGVVLRRYGSGAAAFVDDFLVAGPEPAVRAVIDTSLDEQRSLAQNPAFSAALDGQDGASLQAYASPRGVRGYGRAQKGITGTLAGLLDGPGLRAAGASATVDGSRLRVTARKAGVRAATFAPRLLRKVPGDAVAYVGSASAQPLVALLAGLVGPGTLERLRAALPTAAGLNLDRDVLGPLRGEAAFWVSPGAEAPVLSLAARTTDPGHTQEALARLQAPLAARLGTAPGSPSFEPAAIAGTQAFTLAATPAFAPTYAVTGNTLVASTAPAGLEAFATARRRLPGAASFRAAVPTLPSQAESVGFIDPRQLLALAQQSGLGDGPLSSEARDDLRRVRAAGAVIQRERNDTTAELIFDIP